MSDQLKLAAEPRSEFGKGAARRARVAGQIPAVLYGHGTEPVHVLLPGHDTMMALKHSNALLTITWGKETELAIAKDVQRDPVKRSIDHVDLLIVKKGEKITVDVPVHLVGESFSGTIHVLEHNTLQVVTEATHIPEAIELSIEGLQDGAKIHAGEVKLPSGTELAMDPEALVVAISTPRTSAEPSDEAGGEAPAAASDASASDAADAADAPAEEAAE
jgi:large subunit ribosomal protein L25